MQNDLNDNFSVSSGHHEQAHKMELVKIRLKCLELAAIYDKTGSNVNFLTDSYLKYVLTGEWDIKVKIVT